MFNVTVPLGKAHAMTGKVDAQALLAEEDDYLRVLVLSIVGRTLGPPEREKAPAFRRGAF